MVTVCDRCGRKGKKNKVCYTGICTEVYDFSNGYDLCERCRMILLDKYEGWVNNYGS